MKRVNVVLTRSLNIDGPDHFTSNILFPVLTRLARIAVIAPVLYETLPFTASAVADAVTTALLIKPPNAVAQTPAAPAQRFANFETIDNPVKPIANFIAGERAKGDCN